MLGNKLLNKEWTDFALHAIPEEMARQIEISLRPQPRERHPARIRRNPATESIRRGTFFRLPPY